jgi:DNA polymerase III epsilon subunit-like protein
MKIMVLDTETTGLSKYKKVIPVQIELWPFIVQFSYIVYNNSENKIEKIMNEIIKIPEEEDINQECVAIHGITKEISNKKGVYIDTVLLPFIEDCETADLIVAHNLIFDYKMVITELYRYMSECKDTNRLYKKVENKIELFRNMKEKLYCTMKESIHICNIIAINKFNQEYIKFPKLSELHDFYFGYVPKNLHDSMNDILICFRCFYKLWFNEDICEKNDDIKQMIYIIS